LRRGILYHSFVEPSGYGIAAIGYVRALVNAGVPVRWAPVVRTGPTVRLRTASDALPWAICATEDASLADLPALLEATSGPIAVDTVVVHTVPEYWPALFAPGKRNVGMTVWETDRPPAHWRTLLESAHGVIVPCTQNRDVIVASGARVPVHVVPHVRRHAWNAFAPSELAAARERFGLGEARFVFYAINQWDPRKALPETLDTFVRAFGPDDGVTLLLKTGPLGYGPPPHYGREPSLGMAQRAVDRATDALDRDAPTICVLPYDLNGRGIDMLHELGDAYLSLSHGEGWGIGLFDAATRGTPAVATGWGGHLDYLGPDWPGAVRSRITRVPVWPPWQPSYWPSQRWATPEPEAAIAAMRALVADPAPARAAAQAIAEDIANRYAEPIVAKALLEALA
jgi:hypothetical protein